MSDTTSPAIATINTATNGSAMTGSPRLTESVYAWNQVGVSFLAGGVFNGTVIYAYSALMALMSAELSADAFWQTMPKTAMMISGALVAPFIGPLVDNNPIRRFMALGAICFATGLAFVSTASNIFQVTLIFFLFFGPLQSLLGPLTTSALVSRWFVDRRAFAIGVSNIGISAGGFALPWLIGHLSKTMAWQEILLWLAAGVALLVLPVIWLLTINKPDDYDDRAGLLGGQAGPVHTTRTLIRDQGFWALGLCVAIMYGVNVGVLTNLVQISMGIGLELKQGVHAIMALAAAGMAGKLCIGYLADRVNKCALLAMVLALFMLAVLALAAAENYPQILLCSLAIGFSASSSLPLWHALTASLFGVANFSRVIGLTQLLVFPMVMAGPPVAGWIKVNTGSYQLALYSFACMLMVSVLLVAGIRLKEKKMQARTTS